ncbi:Pimeloyl-[acyl-carrier protein] methyl ester esterase [Streptomyces xanthophaeus]|uniref:alpha/beta fold hydrolase n=1 Tax=Streptomyces xanthophaeus TaxID=67385 RepID=UPI00233F56E2|nr:alpha/beta fold hydrolase [Streptomyces xanthophaeus]WCD84210.1 Pimeloyl-[acyl-carrier protein] methyl ester esterase [Streptomyces xanthophaeus]
MTTTAPAAFARTVRGTGPGLLLAHGAGGGIEANYGPIMDGLAARHTVVGVDYPGTGATPKAQAPLEIDELAEQLIAAADAEGLDTFAVSGYSLGGPVAIRLATLHPERVSSLVLSATLAHADTRTHVAASIWHELFEGGQHTVLAQYLNLMALSEPVLNSLTPAQVRTAAEQLAPALPLGTAEQVDLVRRVDVRGDLAGIAVPTLVVVTTADPLISPNLQRELAASLPTAEVAELHTGHMPFAERPQEWLDLISEFLARNREH